MTDLTDRMRTCAAALAGRRRDALLPENMLNDAADMLIEASNVLENIPEPLGEPMEILKPKSPVAPQQQPPPQRSVPKATWTTNAGDLPPVPTGPPSPRLNRVCPKCDSRAAKRVFRNGTELFLACPACATAWPYAAPSP